MKLSTEQLTNALQGMVRSHLVPDLPLDVSLANPLTGRLIRMHAVAIAQGHRPFPAPTRVLPAVVARAGRSVPRPPSFDFKRAAAGERSDD